MRALPVMLLTPLVARVVTRVDPRIFLTLGFVLNGVAFAFLSLTMTTQTPFSSFVLLLIVSGIGQSMMLVPLLVAMLGNVPPADAPKASSFVSLSVQLGGSIASTMLVTIFDRRTYFHSDTYRGALTLAHPAIRDLVFRHVPVQALARVLQQQAVNAGFADAIFALVPLAVAGVLFVALMRRVKAPPRMPVVLAE
jgi:MFS family permease